MSIPLPSGIVPVRSLTTDEVLYGNRLTSYRWEVLEHSAGTDSLVGELDGVADGSASLSWVVNSAVKGSGGLKVTDTDETKPGRLSIRDVSLSKLRLRPVRVIEGLGIEEPLGVFLVSSAPEEWSSTGRSLSIDLLDRATVLEQDKLAASYAVGTETPILSAVKDVIESAGESINIDASVTTTLGSAMVWPATTPKLQIVNDLLSTLNYSSLWVDGRGRFRATPYVLPADRSLRYELLNGKERKLVDGEDSIYEPDWTRDLDLYNVPNRVVAVQAATGEAPALTGTYSNTDPDSPFSFAARGRWIVKTLEGVETPEGDDASVIAFLESKARQSLVASSAVQSTVKVKHLPIPIRVSDAMRFANTPAGIDARHTVTSIELEAHPLGLMKTSLMEVIDL